MNSCVYVTCKRSISLYVTKSYFVDLSQRIYVVVARDFSCPTTLFTLEDRDDDQQTLRPLNLYHRRIVVALKFFIYNADYMVAYWPEHSTVIASNSFATLLTLCYC